MAKCKHETQKGICEIHSSYSYCHLCDSENLCKAYEPKTNADRIRAMSDEELADWLARTQIANIGEALAIAKIPYEQEDGLKDEVKKDCLEWLKQPAKGE